jgi:predicted ATPase
MPITHYLQLTVVQHQFDFEFLIKNSMLVWKMEIIIKHIGRLPKAKIILDGLTVIAGENDTGKSTVGKVLFSIIKADNMAAANQHCQFMNSCWRN